MNSDLLNKFDKAFNLISSLNMSFINIRFLKIIYVKIQDSNQISYKFKRITALILKWVKKVEHDHRFIKKRILPMLGLKSLRTAKRIIAGIEAMHMIKKGQTLQREESVQNPKEFIHKLFGVVQ